MKIMSKRRILAILAAIIVAVIGSALWDLLQPVMISLASALLNLVTFGIANFKNSLFVELSRGFPEGPSLFLVGIFIYGGGGVSIAVLIRLYLSMRKQEITDNKNAPDEQRPKFAFVHLMIFLSVVVFVLLSAAKVGYMNYAIAYYDQLFNIVSPYISEFEEEKCASRFAQIQTEEDYFDLISELKSVALANKQTVPKFSIW